MTKTPTTTVQSARSNLDFSTAIELVKNYAIFTLDQRGTIVRWNRGAQHIIGWQEDEVRGKHFDLLYSESDTRHGKPAKDLRQALQNDVYQAEDYLVNRNGIAFLADFSIATIYTDKADEPAGYVGVARDITAQHKQEVDQIDANTVLRKEITHRKTIEQALKDSNADLDAFASAASHDLQEPLRMVVSYLQLIDRRYRDKLDKDGKEFLAFAVDGAARMRTLISDLVEYSRIDKLAKPFKVVNTNELVDRVMNNLSLSAYDKKVAITRDDLPDIYGDEIQLNQLFQNLIANAIKFSDKQPALIHVGSKTNAKQHTFLIKDNGKGISASNYSTIFLIFKQLGNRADRRGSGVGLAISKKIISRHSGQIWVESTEGEGSIFYFTIPVHKAKKGYTHG